MGERSRRGVDGVDQGRKNRENVPEDQEWKIAGDKSPSGVLQRPHHRLIETRRPLSTGKFSAKNVTHQHGSEPTSSCLPGRRTTNCVTEFEKNATQITQRRSRARKHLRTFEENQISKYHTENQGKKDNVKISSILQRQKIPEGIRISLENHSSPT